MVYRHSLLREKFPCRGALAGVYLKVLFPGGGMFSLGDIE